MYAIAKTQCDDEIFWIENAVDQLAIRWSSGDAQPRRKRKRQILLSPAWREGARAAAELKLIPKLETAKPDDEVELMIRQLPVCHHHPPHTGFVPGAGLHMV